ncbi:ABC transporter substrate-binding protein [Imhoffiella purpurea]|uniref:Fe/B12 periplasmic-binding domain-containing protein n=1 Tax=Imhoffiella purpurea TaxID=1249627 RepID=W9V8T3_9GAMM|nr:ABC transporter substrate-binding protein [Imhoffiella purpurea]EXJ15814.1 hypothetical protein D779_1038 [Imhoffiella purpurea]
MRRSGIALLLAGLLAGCGPETPPPAAGPTRLVVDMAGQTVAVPQRVERIGCLEVLCYEKLFLLGAADRIAMMTRTDAPWMRRTNPALGRIQQLASDPVIEELLRRRLDVVFHTTGYPEAGKIARLAVMGIPTLVSQTMGRDHPEDIDAFVASRDRMLRLFATVLGPDYAARAEDWCDYHHRMVEMVRARTERIPPAERVRLFHVRGPAATDTQGLGSNTYWYGEIAGADMIVRHSPLIGKGTLSLEEILKWDPQVVNVGRFYSADLVTRDPRWVRVTAVREGRVRELPEGVFYWDGSTEGVLLMLYLAKELYPERFADLDLRAEIRGYYARFYRYALSDTELDLMLQGKGPDGRRRNRMRN